ncbi:MAG: alpha/beta hydrolase-fold protein [bacterium]|nr:alpha/beta hydrolase-fold protein [bacterium]
MKSIVLFIAILVFLVSCEPPEPKSVAKQLNFTDEPNVQVVPNIRDTNLLYDLGKFTSSVRIRMPKTDFRGTILVLQGWNFPNTSWSDSSDLEALASEYGFALVLPDVGKSIYHKRNYEQTRTSWRIYPTRTWLVDTLIRELQDSYQLFDERSKNFVMGLSTGGRGALIIAQENPNIFTAGASLSGDYDQSAFPNDNLYRGFFGTQPEKWNPQENPTSYADEWRVPMYIAHGEADSVVSIAHQRRLSNVVDSVELGEYWQIHFVPKEGHDYHFWASRVAPIMNYFEGFLK